MKKRLSVLVLALAMVLTMSASVFAAGGQNAPNPNNVHDTDAASAMLVKYVQIPEGVDLTKEAMANKTFTFHFAATDSSVPADKNYGVPASVFSDQDFDVVSGKISEMSGATQTAEGQADADTQNKVWSKSIATIFYGADGAKGGEGANADTFTFPRAGEYTFTVTETSTAATGWEFAADSYKLRLVVDNNGTIDDVTVENKAGEKVDPTDVTPGDNTGGATPAASNGGFTFTNKYKPTVTKHDEPKTPNPDPDPTTPSNPGDIAKDEPNLNKGQDGAFELDKFVLGEYGDQTYGFKFNVTVTLPKDYSDFTLPTGWSNKTLKEVTLKHGETFVFDELPVGTKIAVQEQGPVNGYTQLMDTKDVKEGTATTAVTVLITEDGGYAICRNSFDDTSITPTGIIINNLPYVLLIGIALGGIVLFSRKRRYE